MEILKGLIKIDALPGTSEITDVRMSSPGGTRLMIKRDSFFQLLEHASIIDPEQKVIHRNGFSPWCDIEFSTSQGEYILQLFLGGTGIITLPNGKRGALIFEMENMKTEMH
jgi:hypothetical protein